MQEIADELYDLQNYVWWRQRITESFEQFPSEKEVFGIVDNCSTLLQSRPKTIYDYMHDYNAIGLLTSSGEWFVCSEHF